MQKSNPTVQKIKPYDAAHAYIAHTCITESEWEIIACFHEKKRLRGWLQEQLQLYLITMKGYALFCLLTLKILGTIVDEILEFSGKTFFHWQYVINRISPSTASLF